MSSAGGAAVGVLGSAFNPPHLGHLVLAQEAQWQLGLDEIVFVPTGEAPHKRIEPEPGRELRLRMTRAAVAGDPRFSVSAVEVEREGPSYAYETLERLAGERGETELVFVIGADAALGLASWRRPERVVELARLGVARRDGIDEDVLDAALAGVGAAGRASTIAMPRFDVSSTLVRKRAAAGQPFRHLVPDGVADLIAAEGVYA